MNTIFDYLRTPLIQKLSKKELTRCLLLLIGIVCFTTMSVDIISGVPLPLWSITLAAVIKAFFYTIGIVLAELIIAFLSERKNQSRGLSIGKTWLISFIGFSLGFLLLAPYRQSFGHMQHHGAENDLFFFLKIIPVWVLLTYIFIQFHLKEGLSSQIEQLRSINESLSRQQNTDEARFTETGSKKKNNDHKLNFPGKKNLSIPLDNISHIEVIEHYCYIHHLQGDILKKTEIKSSLKKLSKSIPGNLLIQVHRSCLVNLSHIVKIDKIPRSYRIQLRHHNVPINISRYKIGNVLPQIESFINS